MSLELIQRLSAKNSIFELDGVTGKIKKVKLSIDRNGKRFFNKETDKLYINALNIRHAGRKFNNLYKKLKEYEALGRNDQSED